MDHAHRKIEALIAKPETREKGFNTMVHTYQMPLYAHLRRMLGNHEDADDALQNTFIKAWRALDAFRGDAALYTWLYRIASNEALALLRSRRAHADIAHTHAHTGVHPTPTTGDIESRLAAAIEALPPRQRQVFLLRYYDEMSYDDMSHITDLSTGALKASYFHAVKKVEEHLKAHL
jgi:RNA polymerase sigma-70 factor (ECF subfamily)